MDVLPEMPDRLLESGVLADGGWFILEHGKKNSFISHPRFFDLRKYGSVHFSFFTYPEQD
jgi:hypothetical protein